MHVKRVFAVVLFVSVGAIPALPQASQSRQEQLKSHSRLAQQYLSERKPELAVPELKAIIVLDPKNVEAQGNLGVLLFFQGQYADAVPPLRAALSLQPDLWKIQALLGLAEGRIGDRSKERNDLEASFPHLQDEKVKIKVGNALIENYTSTGDLDNAAATVADMLKLEPTDVNLLYTAYRLHSDLADQAMLTLAMVAPDSVQMRQVMAHELARHGDKDAAIANYRQAIQLDPGLAGLHFELAEMLYTSSDPTQQAQAENEYKAALVINPSDEKAECRLGDISAKRGDLKEAATYYTRALKLQPHDSDADTELGKVLISMHEPREAQKMFGEAVQADPTNYVAHYRLSVIYRQQGRAEESKRELEQYRKYKDMKEGLRKTFHRMQVETDKVPTERNTQDETDAPK